jgi:cytochrome b561
LRNAKAFGYGRLLRVLHWLTVILFVTMIGLGIWQEYSKSCFSGACFFTDANNAITILVVHKTIGVVVFALALLRVIVRLTTRSPGHLAGLTRSELALSSAVHFGLYVVLIGIPLSGYLMHSAEAGGRDIVFFGYVLPLIPGIGENWYDWFQFAHLGLIWIGAGLLTLHLAGVAKHQLVDHHDILARMNPFARQVEGGQ